MNHPYTKKLAQHPGLSGRVILVHGFNVRDGGKGTTDGLRPYFEQHGFEVLEFDTGWRGLAGVRWGNAKRARRLARMIQSGDLLLGHSDGCNLINLASWQLGGNAGCKPLATIYCNPALDRDTQLAPQTKGALVFYTRTDRILALARRLPWHPWGDMGRVGYVEKNQVYLDPRYHNINYEHIGIQRAGHSGALREPGHRARIFNYINLFIQSLDN